MLAIQITLVHLVPSGVKCPKYYQLIREQYHYSMVRLDIFFTNEGILRPNYPSLVAPDLNTRGQSTVSHALCSPNFWDASAKRRITAVAIGSQALTLCTADRDTWTGSHVHEAQFQQSNILKCVSVAKKMESVTCHLSQDLSRLATWVLQSNTTSVQVFHETGARQLICIMVTQTLEEFSL